MNQTNKCYAHYDRDTGSQQLLGDHLFNVAKSAANQAGVIGQQDVAFLCGLYHDLGKADRNFQNKLLNEPNRHVDHSTAGAKYLIEKISKVLIEEIKEQEKKGFCEPFLETIAYVISAHHGVYDIPVNDPKVKYPENGNLLRRINYGLDESYHYETDVIEFASMIERELMEIKGYTIDHLIIQAFDNYLSVWQRIGSVEKTEKAFYDALLVRLYLSFLKNADILDTINAYAVEVTPVSSSENDRRIQNYLKSIEQVYANYQNPTSDINKIRTSIAEKVRSRGMTDSAGIYRLNLPTGAGKTKLSMRYAFHQMIEKEKKHFIYITPYLSVLEQNAAEIKKVTGEEGVLEHHSNIVIDENNDRATDGDTKQEAFQAYLLDTWDSPIVLSTMVQFFQTLFKVQSSNIRRFSNLINSVLVLDEVQSLPIEVTTLFNLTLNFLSKIMNVTVVLCTATQPKYDSSGIEHKIQYGGSKGEKADIVLMSADERRVFQRTEISKFNEDDSIATIEDIVSTISGYPDESILIILNTKTAVKKLYQLIKEQEKRPSYHLSTNMCPKHRLDIISNIKRNLKGDKAIICVSTQLIEAGVDLDFDRVIRSYAGIDSIVQANGRCNREGERDKGYVELVNLSKSEENLTMLKSIKAKKEVTEQIIAEMKSPIPIETLNDEFFERYYVNTKKDIFDYPTGDYQPSVYDMLSLNEKNNVKHVALRQSFKTAGLKMDLIQDNSKGIIVYYKKEAEGKAENFEMIEKLIGEIEEFEHDYNMRHLATIKDLMKQLQPYTVNIHSNSKIKEALMDYQEGKIQILPEEFYDCDMGIVDEVEEFIL